MDVPFGFSKFFSLSPKGLILENQSFGIKIYASVISYMSLFY
jgi:hypothetical protein